MAQQMAPRPMVLTGQQMVQQMAQQMVLQTAEAAVHIWEWPKVHRSLLKLML
jgi:hypothetical protein